MGNRKDRFEFTMKSRQGFLGSPTDPWRSLGLLGDPLGSPWYPQGSLRSQGILGIPGDPWGSLGILKDTCGSPMIPEDPEGLYGILKIPQESSGSPRVCPGRLPVGRRYKQLRPTAMCSKYKRSAAWTHATSTRAVTAPSPKGL